ncbi:MAG: ATP-dependent Clp protease proteolytic subunit [Candidatus Aenigmarchaeota archaeon]|nr:ATP-dependent Clp protease proteolytic subunit [Candidatus Aenigmarchaeota archaeon]
MRLAFIFIVLLSSQAFASEVMEFEMKGAMTFGAVNSFSEALADAEEKRIPLVLSIESPGGSVERSLDMLKRIEGSKVPVITFVSGIVSGSAAIPVLGSHALFMAPHASLDFTVPIEVSTSGYHIAGYTDAVVARMESVSLSMGRKFSPMSLGTELSADDAKRLGEIDGIAVSKADALNASDGKSVETSLGKEAISTKDIVMKKHDESVLATILAYLSNPVLSLLLLIFGVYLTMFGFASSGFGAEMMGVGMLAIGAIGTLFNVGIPGIILLVIGVAFLTREIHTPGFGPMGATGILLICAGSILLAPISPAWSFSHEYNNGLLLSISGTSIAVAFFLIFAFRSFYQVPSKEPFMDKHRGQLATAEDDLGRGKEGYISFMGERWKAVSNDEIKKGDSVVITGTKRDATTVKKAH